MATKYYLDQVGLGQFLDYIENNFENQEIVGKPANTLAIAYAGTYSAKSKAPVAVELNAYVAKDGDNVIITDLSDNSTKTYTYRDSLANIKALDNIKDPTVGDLYKIQKSGLYAAWTGAMWFEFGIINGFNERILKNNIRSMTYEALNKILDDGTKIEIVDLSALAPLLECDEPEVKVVLSQDIENASTIAVPAGKKLVLDLGGNKLSNNSTDYIVNVSGGEVVLQNGQIESQGRPVVCTSGGTVTINHARVESKNDVAVSVTGEGSKVVMNSGKVTAQESGILVTTNASLELNGGEIECWDNSPIQGNGTVKPNNDQGHVEIIMNGGTLKAHIQSNGWTACGVYMPNSGKFIMNGGEIISDGAGLVMRAGEVELNGGSIIATGTAGVRGKVGDSQIVIGPYAVTYDEKANYPGAANGEFKLTVSEDMYLEGTDGAIEARLSENGQANIINNSNGKYVVFENRSI